MPEYLAPGVYIEETSFRPKTIEGVSTSTAGFVGPARFGPIEGVPELLTSFTDFERTYGGIDKLEFSEIKQDNYLAHAVRAYFENGGKRLYVSRIYSPPADASDGNGYATGSIGQENIKLAARYPGKCGNMIVDFLFKVGQNIIGEDKIDENNKRTILRGASEFDIVLLKTTNIDNKLYWLEFNKEKNTYRLREKNPLDNEDDLFVTDIIYSEDEDETKRPTAKIITVNVTIGMPGKFSSPVTFENLSFHPDHKKSLGKVFSESPNDRYTELYVPLIIKTGLLNGTAIAEALLDEEINEKKVRSSYTIDTSKDSERTLRKVLTKGHDGQRPTNTLYFGSETSTTTQDSEKPLKSGLKAFEDIEDISIVAAPGSSFDYNNNKYKNDVVTILGHLINHCEKMRYRIAVLDSSNKQLLSDVRKYRGQLDSKHAALYYPWVIILDPLTGEKLNLPPSGFVAGIYARNDVEYGVHKAPANEVVKLAIGFDVMLNKSQQDVLNPEAINCFRFFEGRGYRLWGARIITSDPEWKYVNLRRYFAYLERSIDKGTQWIVFENNSEKLWANVKSTVEDFLFNEWKSGHLMGESVKEAYFVKCDRSTMTQNDIDNGRMICLIGVAPVRPAEFVIFRIGQKLLDTKA